MLFRILFCFFYLITTGWSANKYLFEHNRQSQATTHHAHQQPLPYKHQHNQNNAAPIIYEKEYFFFSAPEDAAEETEALNKLISTVKKRQQVVFIKPPINHAYEAALKSLIQNTAQQKTHIYVFGKESNYHDLKQKFQRIQQDMQNKPRVYFIKYRNPLEAQRIQSAIIEKYGSANGNRYAQPSPPLRTSDNTPVSKNYAMNFLPTGVDVVPGSSYIPLFFLI